MQGGQNGGMNPFMAGGGYQQQMPQMMQPPPPQPMYQQQQMPQQHMMMPQQQTMDSVNMVKTGYVNCVLLYCFTNGWHG